MITKYVPVIIFIVLIGTVIYAFFFIQAATPPGQTREITRTHFAATCIEGTAEACNTGRNCGGVRQCIRGSWTGCIIEEACRPGERIPCVPDGCTIGYKACNECGSGYGECIIDEGAST